MIGIDRMAKLWWLWSMVQSGGRILTRHPHTLHTFISGDKKTLCHFLFSLNYAQIEIYAGPNKYHGNSLEAFMWNFVVFQKNLWNNIFANSYFNYVMNNKGI